MSGKNKEPEFDNNLIKRILDMRNFKITQKADFKKIKDEKGLIIFARNKTTGRRIVVLYAVKDVLGVAWVRELFALMKEHRVTRGILYGGNRVTPAAKKAALKMHIEILHITPLTYRLFDHEYVPEHTIATKEEIIELIKRFSINRLELARILDQAETSIDRVKLLDTVLDGVLGAVIQPDGEFYPKQKDGGLIVDTSDIILHTRISQKPDVFKADGFILEGKIIAKSQLDKIEKVKLAIYTGDISAEDKKAVKSFAESLTKQGVNLLLSVKEIPKKFKLAFSSGITVLSGIRPTILSRLVLETGAQPFDDISANKKLVVGQAGYATIRQTKNNAIVSICNCQNRSLFRFRFLTKEDVKFTRGRLGPSESAIYNDLQFYRTGKLLVLENTVGDISTSEMDLIKAKLLELNVNLILTSSFFPLSLQAQLMKTGATVVTLVPKEDLDKIAKITGATPILDLGMIDESMLGTSQIMFERAQSNIISFYLSETDEAQLESLRKAVKEIINYIKTKVESGVSKLLPYIRREDPVVLLLGAKYGDVIKIIRKSPTARVSTTYRIVYKG
ncbi:MAG: DNA-directed RNA polymerase subunit RpoH/Rpb5 C-terminal domain-containing protein [Candidatus Ranarchaeia archaeon]